MVLGCRVLGFRVVGFRGLGFRAERSLHLTVTPRSHLDLGSRVKGLRRKDWGLGFRV